MSNEKFITWKNGLLGLTAAFIPVLTFLYVIFSFVSEAKVNSVENRRSLTTIEKTLTLEIQDRKQSEKEILKYINEVIKVDMKETIKTQIEPLRKDMYLIKSLQYQTLKEQKKANQIQNN